MGTPRGSAMERTWMYDMLDRRTGRKVALLYHRGTAHYLDFGEAYHELMHMRRCGCGCGLLENY